MAGPLNFPNSPGHGDTYAGGPGGGTWTWDGAKWESSTSASLYLPISGGTLTGALTLSGDATAALNPVSLQQLQNGYLPLSGGTVTGALAVSGGIRGVTDGSNAAAGMVGEYMTVTGTQQTFSGPGTVINLVSLTLTPGDWDVQGTIYFSGDQQVYICSAGINTVSATLDTFASAIQNPSYAGVWWSCVPTTRYRFNITASTVVYLVGRQGGWVSTAGTYLRGTGMMQARRMR